MVSRDADITGGIVVGHDGSRAAGAVVRRAGELAQRLGIEGRSKMDRGELVAAIDKANRRETARARRR